MTARLPSRRSLIRKVEEQAKWIKFLANAQWSMALRAPLRGDYERSAQAWMGRPHPGDLVVELSSAFRRATDLASVGTLLSFERAKGERVYEIAALHRKKTYRWVNCQFIRPICTPEQDLLVLGDSGRDAAHLRAHRIPWCSSQRDVSFELLGLADDQWTWRMRCKGCEQIFTRRKHSDDDPLCPTCHVPEPSPTEPCLYCSPNPT